MYTDINLCAAIFCCYYRIIQWFRYFTTCTLTDDRSWVKAKHIHVHVHVHVYNVHVHVLCVMLLLIIHSFRLKCFLPRMASLPSVHFTEIVEQNWIKISPVTEKRNKLYRNRSGAFTKNQQTMSSPVPTRVIKGFVVEEPEQINEGGEVGGDQCARCLAMSEELAIASRLNETLLKKFSSIMQSIDKGKKLIESFDKDFGIKTDEKTKPVFIASQNVCLMDEKEKKERRESGLEFEDINLTNNMFPVSDHMVSLSEIDSLSRKLYQYLNECREISLSSANSCFESRFCFSSGDLPISSTRPPLLRMHTLSNTTDISRLSSSIEHSVEVGALGRRGTPSQQPFLPHYHSEQHPNDRLGSLRRTHSENELFVSGLESRVLLIDTSPVTSKKDEREHYFIIVIINLICLLRISYMYILYYCV